MHTPFMSIRFQGGQPTGPKFTCTGHPQAIIHSRALEPRTKAFSQGPKPWLFSAHLLMDPMGPPYLASGLLHNRKSQAK